jgi:hypothetical protein
MQAMSDASSNPLHRLLGDWCGKETIQPSQWGAGGPAQAQVACREALGGKAFVQDYQAERDGKTWLQAHAVYIRQANEPDYALFWFDSLASCPGNRPGEHGTATPSPSSARRRAGKAATRTRSSMTTPTK